MPNSAGIFNWHDAITKAYSTKVLVIGDIILDVFEYGEVSAFPLKFLFLFLRIHKEYALGVQQMLQI